MTAKAGGVSPARTNRITRSVPVSDSFCRVGGAKREESAPLELRTVRSPRNLLDPSTRLHIADDQIHSVSAVGMLITKDIAKLREPCGSRTLLIGFGIRQREQGLTVTLAA